MKSLLYEPSSCELYVRMCNCMSQFTCLHTLLCVHNLYRRLCFVYFPVQCCVGCSSIGSLFQSQDVQRQVERQGDAAGTVRLKMFCFFLYIQYLYGKYCKPITLQSYIADCVSWVPRLTLLGFTNKSDLQTSSWKGTYLYVEDSFL